MGEVIQFEDLDADLEKPKWFYKECERLSHMVYDEFRQLVESFPFGSLPLDDLFHAIADTPVRLMALMQGDVELESYVAVSGLYRAAMDKMANQRCEA